MIEKMITLSTPKDCINQIVEGYATIQMGYGLADEAMVAYLQMDGCTIQTLYDDLQKAGCDLAKKTLQNRQSILRGEGKLPPADARYRRDGNGGDSRAGNGKGLDAQLTGELFRLGRRMIDAGQRFQDSLKPDEFQAIEEQAVEIFASVFEQVELLNEAIQFYETNLDGLIATSPFAGSYYLQRIRDFEDTKRMYEQEFAYIFGAK